MGQFSWITQDEGTSIRESYGCDDKYLISAYMHDNKGNVYEEKNYEGYGVFGGKDFYQLLAEMNNLAVNGDEDHDRSLGIDLYFNEEGIKFISPNLTRHKSWNWIPDAPKDDPNQGWGPDEGLYDEDDGWEDSHWE